MKRSLIIAAALVLAGLQGAQAASCDPDADAKAAAAKCLAGVNVNIDYSGIARCKSVGQQAHDACEAANTVGSQKNTLQKQPGSQPISKPGHIVPDLGDPTKLGTPENDN